MKYYFLILPIIVILSACSNDDDIVNPKGVIEISAQMSCLVENEYIPDNGAVLYIFENFNNEIDYIYQKGTFVHNQTGEIITHSIKGIANEKGLATIEVKYGQKSIVVLESAKYPELYMQKVYDINHGQTVIGIRNVRFNPNRQNS